MDSHRPTLYSAVFSCVVMAVEMKHPRYNPRRGKCLSYLSYSILTSPSIPCFIHDSKARNFPTSVLKIEILERMDSDEDIATLGSIIEYIKIMLVLFNLKEKACDQRSR